jgi:hypothetical protein
MTALTARQAELLTPNERRRLERLEAAIPRLRGFRWIHCQRLIGKLESRALDRELPMRMQF